MNKTLVTIICALAVLGLGIAIFSNHKGSSLPQVLDTTPIEQNYEVPIMPAGMREYQSAAYHFSLFYPKDIVVNERPEGGGAVTITFQNVEKAEGFQIFVVPYNESQVSEQRFKQDVPSGVRESLTDIVVDGATGAAFYSTNIALGATREVWFIHGGFLYEVTTLKPLETWLNEIMRSWKFIP